MIKTIKTITRTVAVVTGLIVAIIELREAIGAFRKEWRKRQEEDRPASQRADTHPEDL